MHNEDIQTVRLVLNEGQARAKLDGLRGQLEEIRQKKKEAFENGNGEAFRFYEAEAKKVTRQMERMQSRAENIGRVLVNLDQASPRQLQQTLSRITKELNSGAVQRGSKEWNTLIQALRETRKELGKVRDEMNTGGPADPLKWLKLDSIINIARSGVDAFSSLKAAMEEYVQAAADMGEHTSNVAKYTGLSTQEVNELNETFKKMDTRTPREKLNDLAADAGRLGIQSKESVRDFVEAADAINLALGEDLGEDAVKNIGKLAQLFGEDDKLGLKQAMLSTASVINELAQSSSASEGYLLEFTSRLAGVGKQAGLTQSQIMAFGSVLDQAGMNVELSATALQNVLMAIYRAPAEMARIAGLDVQQFTNQLKTDANGAVLSFLGALRQTGGLDQLAPMLDKMKLSGMGVSATLSTLSDNLDGLKSTQVQAVEAFKAGTSATEEARKANSTEAAQLEKKRKELASVRVEIGEKLLPVYNALTGAQLTGLTGLKHFTGFIIEHRKTLAAVAVAVAAYELALRRAAIAQALMTAKTKIATAAVATYKSSVLLLMSGYYALTGATDKAKVATRAFHTALKASPVGFAIALITTLVGVVGSLVEARRSEAAALKNSFDVQKKVNGLKEEGARNADRERAEIERLSSVLHDNSAKLSDRRAALARIKEITPAYLGQLDKEGRLTRDNAKAIDEYIAALERKSIAEALSKGMDDAIVKRLKAERERTTAQADIAAIEKELNKPEYRTTSFAMPSTAGAVNVDSPHAAAARNLHNRLVAARKTLERAKKEQEECTQLIEEIKQQSKTYNASLISADVSGTGNNGGTGSYSGGTSGSASNSGIKQTADKIRTEMQNTRNALRLQLDNGMIDHKMYCQSLTQSEEQMYKRLKELYRGNAKELANIEKERLEAAEQNRKNETVWSLKELEHRKNAEIELIRENFIHGTLTAEEFRREQERAELEHLKRKAEYLKQYGTPEEAEEADRLYTEQAQEAQLRNMQDFWQRVQDFRKEFQQSSNEEQMQTWLNFADELHKNGLLDEMEYQKALGSIREKYEKKSNDEGDNNPETWALGAPNDQMAAGIVSFMEQFEQLNLKIKEGGATWQDYASVGVSALGMVSAMAAGASQLVQANQAAEEAKVRRRYDAEIKAAGKNKKKKKQLEEQKEKDMAKIKSKYAKKAMAMQIAQAIASTASNAILAYGSVLMRGVPWTYPLAAVAAATAVASGMMQVAAIRKQAAAQSEGYFSGGFTGGRNYRREAGVVHEGEFVANHIAVENPHLLPVFRLLDEAQRNNTVASLTATDVSRSLSLPAAAQAVGQSVAAQTVTAETSAGAEVLSRIAEKLETPLQAYVVIDGPEGLDRQWKKYRNLQRH